ncbi:MAG: RluA family pseudouridine synthase [Clostridia bacterium]|nr:RluA family pseudouridine synthase [Clostridia bacterium]
MKYKIIEEKSSMILIDILRNEMTFSSRLIRLLKREKRVQVNGHPLSFNATLRIGDLITVDMPKEENIFEPEDIPVEVLYEDDAFIVVNKQPFLVVHPTKGHPTGTLANGLANYMISRDELYKIRFANRLDRDTSGAMIICKNAFAQKKISDQMNDNSINKQYYALVHGNVEKDAGTIDAPIDREFDDSIIRVVTEDGMRSVTHYEVVERFDGYTLLLITLETGRTHQIRVHLKHLGHIIVGDELYGSNHQLINRQALHAIHLDFKDINDNPIEINAPLLEDMSSLLERLRKS